jgi:hypothetical protein
MVAGAAGALIGILLMLFSTIVFAKPTFTETCDRFKEEAKDYPEGKRANSHTINGKFEYSCERKNAAHYRHLEVPINKLGGADWKVAVDRWHHKEGLCTLRSVREAVDSGWAVSMIYVEPSGQAFTVRCNNSTLAPSVLGIPAPSASMTADEKTCASLAQDAHSMVGMRVDDYTRIQYVSYDCKAKTVYYSHRYDHAKVRGHDGTWEAYVERTTAEVRGEICTADQFAKMKKNGWTVAFNFMPITGLPAGAPNLTINCDPNTKRWNNVTILK